MFTDYADEWFTRENRHGCFHEMNKIVSLSLEWSFIQNTLNLLNFGIGIKRWVSVISYYQEVLARVAACRRICASWELEF